MPIIQALEAPGLPSAFACVGLRKVKEAVLLVHEAAAKQINSGALMADAWHHRSDAMSSVEFNRHFRGKAWVSVLDPAAGAVILRFIVKAAVGIFRDAICKMTDVM